MTQRGWLTTDHWSPARACSSPRPPWRRRPTPASTAAERQSRSAGAGFLCLVPEKREREVQLPAGQAERVQGTEERRARVLSGGLLARLHRRDGEIPGAVRSVQREQHGHPGHERGQHVGERSIRRQTRREVPDLSDASRDIAKSYGVFNEKQLVANRTTFIIDKNGVVQKEFISTEALDPNKSLEACALLKEVK